MEMNSMLIIKEWVKDEIKEEIKKFLEANENKLTTIQNLWDTVKAVQKGKFIVVGSVIPGAGSLKI